MNVLGPTLLCVEAFGLLDVLGSGPLLAMAALTRCVAQMSGRAWTPAVRRLGRVLVAQAASVDAAPVHIQPVKDVFLVREVLRVVALLVRRYRNDSSTLTAWGDAIVRVRTPDAPLRRREPVVAC